MRATFGERVRAWRAARGLKQTELARAAGMEAIRLCRIEKGSRVANVDEMERLAAALAITVGGLSEMPPAAEPAQGGEAA